MIWQRVSKELARPARNKKGVNVSHIQKHVRDGESAVVAGKVLGTGAVTKALTIYAYQYSESAKKKIEAAGGKALQLDEGKKAKNLRLIK